MFKLNDTDKFRNTLSSQICSTFHIRKSRSLYVSRPWFHNRHQLPKNQNNKVLPLNIKWGPSIWPFIFQRHCYHTNYIYEAQLRSTSVPFPSQVFCYLMYCQLFFVRYSSYSWDLPQAWLSLSAEGNFFVVKIFAIGSLHLQDLVYSSVRSLKPMYKVLRPLGRNSPSAEPLTYSLGSEETHLKPAPCPFCSTHLARVSTLISSHSIPYAAPPC